MFVYQKNNLIDCLSCEHCSRPYHFNQEPKFLYCCGKTVCKECVDSITFTPETYVCVACHRSFPTPSERCFPTNTPIVKLIRQQADFIYQGTETTKLRASLEELKPRLVSFFALRDETLQKIEYVRKCQYKDTEEIFFRNVKVLLDTLIRARQEGDNGVNSLRNDVLSLRDSYPLAAQCSDYMDNVSAISDVNSLELNKLVAKDVADLKSSISILNCVGDHIKKMAAKMVQFKQTGPPLSDEFNRSRMDESTPTTTTAAATQDSDFFSNISIDDVCSIFTFYYIFSLKTHAHFLKFEDVSIGLDNPQTLCDNDLGAFLDVVCNNNSSNKILPSDSSGVGSQYEPVTPQNI